MLLSARPAQHELGCLSGGDMLDAPVAEARKIETGEETFAASKQDRRDHDMHIVDHPGTQVLLDGSDTATQPDVLSLGASRARSSAE